MKPSRFAFLVLYGILALVGLLLAAAAQDIGIAVFGWGLVLFGILSIFHTLRLHFDELERLR